MPVTVVTGIFIFGSWAR